MLISLKRWWNSLDSFDLSAFALIAICFAYLGWQFWIRKP